ncbi:MAG: hypothetical protein E7194_00020 [Erysipelotrichaceae bacterium]|nr:hypothetical protein [Erysipelotrichaceae bacterium]
MNELEKLNKELKSYNAKQLNDLAIDMRDSLIELMTDYVAVLSAMADTAKNAGASKSLAIIEAIGTELDDSITGLCGCAPELPTECPNRIEGTKHEWN